MKLSLLSFILKQQGSLLADFNLERERNIFSIPEIFCFPEVVAVSSKLKCTEGESQKHLDPYSLPIGALD